MSDRACRGKIYDDYTSFLKADGLKERIRLADLFRRSSKFEKSTQHVCVLSTLVRAPRDLLLDVATADEILERRRGMVRADLAGLQSIDVVVISAHRL